MEVILKLFCDKLPQESELFKVKPTKDKAEIEFINVLEACKKCNSKVIDIIRFDLWGNQFETVRLTNKKAERYLKNIVIIQKFENIKEKYTNEPDYRWVYGYLNKARDLKTDRLIKAA